MLSTVFQFFSSPVAHKSYALDPKPWCSCSAADACTACTGLVFAATTPDLARDVRKPRRREAPGGRLGLRHSLRVEAGKTIPADVHLGIMSPQTTTVDQHCSEAPRAQSPSKQTNGNTQHCTTEGLWRCARQQARNSEILWIQSFPISERS